MKPHYQIHGAARCCYSGRVVAAALVFALLSACGARAESTDPSDSAPIAAIVEATPQPQAAPTRAESLLARGAAAIDAQRWAAAELAYTELLDVEPDRAEAHVNRAAARLHLSRYDEARADIEAALTLAPDDLRVIRFAASAFAWLGMFDRSAELTALLPEDERSTLLLAVNAIGLRSSQNAVTQLRTLIGASSDPLQLWRAHNALGVALAMLGENTAAHAHFEIAANLAPNATQPIMNAARLFLAAGREDQARPLLQRYLELAGPSVPDRGFVEAALAP